VNKFGGFGQFFSDQLSDNFRRALAGGFRFCFYVVCRNAVKGVKRIDKLILLV
jgi:hypothetical protein